MKKIICLVLALLMLFALCGCGAGTVVPSEEPTVEKPDDGNNIGNPIESATVESLFNEMGIDFSGFSQFKDASFSKINGTPVIGQVDFSLNGDKYNARIAPLASEQSIDGLYFDWSDTSEAEVGYCTASVKLTKEGQGVISWYDIAPGIMYSISMTENATADKLVSVANEVFSPVQGNADGDNAALLGALLDKMVANYRPGTAGSSMNGFAIAAEMADSFAGMNISADEAGAVVKDYVSAISDDEKANFPERMNGIVNAYGELAANGLEPLSGCGYEAVNYPWPESVAACFEAMGSAVK